MRSSTVIVKAMILMPLLLVAGLRGFGQISSQPAKADLKKDAPRVFLDFPGLDLPFLQKEISFVTYVQNRAEAQVLVQVTSQKTESGEEYTLVFSGQKEFAGVNDTLKFSAGLAQKPDEVRQELAGRLKLGLLRYVAKTPISSRVDIALKEQVKPTAVIDKWHFWVFSVGANAFLNGEQSYKSKMWYGNLSAIRVTPEWKIRLSFNGMSQKDNYSYEDFVYQSIAKSFGFNGLVVRSLNDHWSIGAYVEAFSSTFSNTRLSVSPHPAIEYDLFPYSQSTKRQLRFLYRVGYGYVKYYEETIYDKVKENLWGEDFSVNLDLKQPWGTISASLEGWHYFQDLSKYQLELNGEVSLRIFKGLNLNIDGGGARVHDQLSLAKGGATLEEVLLRRKQVATNYNYYISVGLSFTFGSIHSNVVNPRFGSGSSGFSMNISM